jgi:hypothetical protein
VSKSTHEFDNANKERTQLQLQTSVTVCPNQICREYIVDAVLHKTEPSSDVTGRPYYQIVQPALLEWRLRPKSKAKPFPAYIPAPIRTDYEEACLILTDSPKASATLSRRCLQGIIRDFWDISKDRLIDEIRDLKGKVDGATWSAIDAVRSIGNIGAHMEKDINLIIDVDPGEAEVLIRLLETLFDDWYVTRHERDEQMQQIVAIAQSKADLKANPPHVAATTT